MIPQFEEIRIQALKELSAGIVMRAKDLRIPLAKHFGLTDEEMNAWYPSGNGEIFLDRISWALSYLFIAGLVEKPQRGDYKISEKGLSMLSSCTYNPQIQISAESETKRSIFREKDKTKRSKKESAQHSKSRNKSFVMTSVSAL